MMGVGQGHFGIKRRKFAVLIATKGDTRRERAAGKVVRRVRVAKGREDGSNERVSRKMRQDNGVEVLRKGAEGKVTWEETCQGGVKVRGV